MKVKDQVTIVRNLRFEVMATEGDANISPDRMSDAIRRGNFHDQAVGGSFWISFGRPTCPTCHQNCAPEKRVLIKRVA